MFKIFSIKRLFVLPVVVLLSACVAPVQHLDYSAFKRSQPRSILVLPPINETSDIAATYGLLSQVTQPLAEAGYYVVPVAVMNEAFKHNGLTEPTDIQSVSASKLREIFGADAALYPKVSQYGTVFKLLDSTTVVTASAKLVDLRTGDMLWQGSATANEKELDHHADAGGGGIVGMLARAALKQIAHSVMDKSRDVAGLTSSRLFSAGPPDGLLYGPRSPKYGTD